MTIDFEAETPLWQQLADILCGDISAGVYPRGKVIPSETTLVQQHGLSRGTVRKALDALVAEGLIRRRQGRGSFVV